MHKHIDLVDNLSAKGSLTGRGSGSKTSGSKNHKSKVLLCNKSNRSVGTVSKRSPVSKSKSKTKQLKKSPDDLGDGIIFKTMQEPRKDKEEALINQDLHQFMSNDMDQQKQVNMYNHETEIFSGRKRRMKANLI